MFNFKNIAKTAKENASARAYYALLEELEEFIPAKKMIGDIKAQEVPVLTLAGAVALGLAKGELNEEQAKGFVSVCVENADEAASFFASLPTVLEPSCQWYKRNNKFFSVERDAIISLCGVVMDEKQADALATAADKANQELAEKAEKTQERINKAKALFQ